MTRKYVPLFTIHLECGHQLGRRFPCTDLTSLYCPTCNDEIWIKGFTIIEPKNTKDIRQNMSALDLSEVWRYK